jgi:hypothetical protein
MDIIKKPVTNHAELANVLGDGQLHISQTVESALTDVNAQLDDLHTDGDPIFGGLTVGSAKNANYGVDVSLPAESPSPNVRVTASSTTTNGGDVEITAGSGDTTGGSITLTPGESLGLYGIVDLDGRVSINGSLDIEGVETTLVGGTSNLASANAIKSSIDAIGYLGNLTTAQRDELPTPSPGNWIHNIDRGFRIETYSTGWPNETFTIIDNVTSYTGLGGAASGAKSLGYELDNGVVDNCNFVGKIPDLGEITKIEFIFSASDDVGAGDFVLDIITQCGTAEEPYDEHTVSDSGNIVSIVANDQYVVRAFELPITVLAGVDKNDIIRFYCARQGSAGSDTFSGAVLAIGIKITYIAYIDSQGGGSSPGGDSSTERSIFVDRKASGTNGGASTSDAYVTRDLNTSVINEITGISLSSNQITIPAGKWLIDISAPAIQSGGHRVALYCITDSAYVFFGSSEYAVTTGLYAATRSKIHDVLEIASAKVYEIRHYVSSGRTYGLGYPASSGEDEEYTKLIITTT